MTPKVLRLLVLVAVFSWVRATEERPKKKREDPALYFQDLDSMVKQDLFVLDDKYQQLVVPLMPTKLEGLREVPLHIPVKPEEDPPSYQDEVLNSDVQNPTNGRWGFTLGQGQQQQAFQQQLSPMQQQLYQPQQQQQLQLFPNQLQQSMFQSGQQQLYQPQQQQQQQQQLYQPQQQQQQQQLYQPQQQQQLYQPQQQQQVYLLDQQQPSLRLQQDDLQSSGLQSLQQLVQARQQLQQNYGAGYSDFEASGGQVAAQLQAGSLHLLADIAGGQEYGTGAQSSGGQYRSTSHLESSSVAGGQKVTVVSHIDHHIR